MEAEGARESDFLFSVLLDPHLRSAGTGHWALLHCNCRGRLISPLAVAETGFSGVPLAANAGQAQWAKRPGPGPPPPESPHAQSQAGPQCRCAC